MKKAFLLILLCVSYLAPCNAQEVVYVEDPSQGYLFNRMRDNWFIDAEGGVGLLMSPYDANAPFSKRIGAKANLHVGKWFSPLIGLRFGGDFEQLRVLPGPATMPPWVTVTGPRCIRTADMLPHTSMT